jgi:hypothetical protein
MLHKTRHDGKRIRPSACQMRKCRMEISHRLASVIDTCAADRTLDRSGTSQLRVACPANRVHALVTRQDASRVTFFPSLLRQINLQKTDQVLRVLNNVCICRCVEKVRTLHPDLGTVSPISSHTGTTAPTLSTIIRMHAFERREIWSFCFTCCWRYT